MRTSVWNGCNMTSYVYPGCGYGGYCLPKDTNALLALSKAKGFLPGILDQVISTNNAMPKRIAARIMAKAAPDDRIAILGLSFKPGSDDVRQSPAAPILRHLQENGYRNLAAYDPAANELFHAAYPDLALQYKDSMAKALHGAAFAVILTAWPEFAQVMQHTNAPIIDCRYMLS